MSSKVNIGRVYARHIQTKTAPTVTAMSMIGDFAISKQMFHGPLDWHADKASDDMMIVLVNDGMAVVNGSYVPAEGVYWMRADRSAKVEWPTPSRATCIYLPASALPDSVWEVADVDFRSEPSKVSQSALAFVTTLIESRAAVNGRLTDYLAEQLLSDIVAALIMEAQDIKSFTAVVERTPYEAAMMYMRLHSTSRDLTVDSIAAALNISGRSLQRALAERDTTLTVALRDIRAEHALRILNEPSRRITMTRVAEITGFANPASLRRALREHAASAAGTPAPPPIPTSADFSTTGEITPISAPVAPTQTEPVNFKERLQQSLSGTGRRSAD